MNARATTTGFRALDRGLKDLDARGVKALQRRAVNAGLRVVARAQKNAAPVGETGLLKRSIGSRFRKFGRGAGKVLTGKAGINVATAGARAKGRYAPHGHLVALGTRPRVTKAGASRGRVGANDFIRGAAAAAGRSALAAAELAVRRALPAEVAKSFDRSK